MKVGIVIPALNEEGCIGTVVADCLNHAGDNDVRVVVCDNGSTDKTAEIAKSTGAEVVEESYRGYGAACLKAIAHLTDWPDVIAFVDGDGASEMTEFTSLLEPIKNNQAELVIGKRNISSKSMTPPQRWGNWLATTLVRLRWRKKFGDLGPFRTIRKETYDCMKMADKTWGWTVEMQIKAIIQGVRVVEVPVSWKDRIAGKSKISGSVMGVLRAGCKILWTIGKYSLKSVPQSRQSEITKTPEDGNAQVTTGTKDI